MGEEKKKFDLVQIVKDKNLMKILPVLLNVKDVNNWTITPSQFIQEMNLTTEERYKKLIQFHALEVSSDNSGIVVIPKILIFQSFETRKIYSLPVQIINRRKGLLPLKVTCPKSIHFKTHSVGNRMAKIAPGLSVEYKVTFFPSELKDYYHFVTLTTEESTYKLPILAIGPRPLLDIPDEIIMPPAPVKIPSSKTIIVRNIGLIPANFTFTTKGNFKIEPSKGVVGFQEVMELRVIFESMVMGSYCETIYLNLESGEKLAIKVRCTAENVSVRLDKNCITQDDTFIGLERCKIFHLINNSQSMIQYSWKRHKTMKEDLEIIESMKDKYEEVKQIEVLKNAKQIYYEVCSDKCHELAWDRILQDELRFLQEEEFNFQHPNFRIEPECGHIFPKSKQEMLAFFQPTECGPISADAYLEVSGRDERLTLQLKGVGLGPLIVLSVEVIDIDFIFLCSVHTYEVIAYNKGDINGIIRFKQEQLVFGGKVEVIPNERLLKPNEHAAFIISFTSNRQGEFTEKLSFQIVESGEIANLVIKGKIVSPTLHFDKTHIDFGIVPVGFPATKEVTLANLSMVPVTFSLRMLSDGNDPAMNITKYAKLEVKPPLSKSPKEFYIHPNEGVVEPFSSRTVTLKLTANLSRKWTTNLMVDMWDSDTESVSCPIRWNSQTACLRAEPKIISIPFCFINFPYTRMVTLLNPTKISAFFYFIPQEQNERTTIKYSANEPQGIVEPRGSARVTLTILVAALGRQTIPIKVHVFGNEFPTEMFEICCVGQGPVVTLQPAVLHWGEVQLLQEKKEYLMIINESPVPAYFTSSMYKSDSPWIVSPSQSKLEPGEKINLQVSLLLRDRGKYHDMIKIQIANGKILSCVTTAVGIGYSLVLEPNIAGKYDWGTLFCQKKYLFKIVVKNEGTKLVGITWCPIEDYRLFVNQKFTVPEHLVFKVEPSRGDITGGSGKVFNVLVMSPKPGIFSQKFYCHSNVDASSNEVFMTSEMVAEFVEPIVKFDKSFLKFYYNVEPTGIESKITDVVNIRNVSILPISVSLSLNSPFYLTNEVDQIVEKLELDLAGEETLPVTVGFFVKEVKAKMCCIYKEKLNIVFKESSKKLMLPLIGEINYPNVIILPRKVSFDCIPVGTTAYREFILVNISPVVVNYTISWGEKASVVHHMKVAETSFAEDQTVKSIDFCDFVNYYPESEILSGESARRGEQTQLTPDNESQETELDQKSELHELIPPEKPVLKIPEIKITPNEVRDAILPLAQKYYTRDEPLTEAFKARPPATQITERKPAFMNV